MKIFKLLSNLLGLLALPSLIFPQEPSSNFFETLMNEVSASQSSEFKHSLFDYENIFRMLDDIETGKIYLCSEKEIDKVNYLICFLAQKGFIENSHDCYAHEKLEKDIQELSASNFYCNIANETFQAIPAIYLNNPDIYLCRSWFKKTWDSTRNFVKEHKTEIIIGAIVVAAAITVAVIVSTSIGGAVATAAGAATSYAENSPDHPTYNHQSESCDFQQEPSAENKVPEQQPAAQKIYIDSPLLQEIIEDNIHSVKERIGETNFISTTTILELSKDPTFLDKARQMGSYLAHETWDSFGLVTEVVPDILNTVTTAGQAIGIDKIFNQNSNATLFPNPVERHQNMILTGHQKIDEFFSTNLSHKYKDEPSLIQFSYGTLPPLSLAPGIFSDIKALSEAGKIADKAGFTKAGRSLMKHGYREGSIFPKPTGNPIQVNEYGQKILETILNHPERKFIEGEFTRYGKVVDIVVSGVGRVRYGINGNFIGFLEP